MTQESSRARLDRAKARLLMFTCGAGDRKRMAAVMLFRAFPIEAPLTITPAWVLHEGKPVIGLLRCSRSDR